MVLPVRRGAFDAHGRRELDGRRVFVVDQLLRRVDGVLRLRLDHWRGSVGDVGTWGDVLLIARQPPRFIGRELGAAAEAAT